MRQTLSKLRLVCFRALVAPLAVLAIAANAADQLPTQAASDPSTAAAIPAVSSSDDIPGFGVPVGDASLARFRGGDATEQDIDIHGNVDGNTASGIISGDNAISGGAFGNAAGINTVIQNSGSNVLIQNGMNVNVQFADPGQ